VLGPLNKLRGVGYLGPHDGGAAAARAPDCRPVYHQSEGQPREDGDQEIAVAAAARREGQEQQLELRGRSGWDGVRGEVVLEAWVASIK
jgi:hypothetical protein